MKKLRVTVDGKVFNVTVEMLDEPAAAAPVTRPATAAAPVVSPAPLAPPAAVATAPRTDGSPGDVHSPLSGKVVSIDVTIGQVVEEGAQVATIEAMKMNTYVYAPKSGKVTSIVASAGTAIEEGSALLVIG